MPYLRARQIVAAFGCIAICWLDACTTVQVGNDYDHAANFASYRTFTLMQREHQGIRNPLVAMRAEDDIKQELQRRGYTLAPGPESADFTVDFTLGSQERTDISS
jgi:hypothetical protein